jgi:hypothetical protein
MNLKWNDIDYFTSYTCQSMIHLHDEAEAIYKKYQRLHDFELYLTNTLRRDGEISMSEVDRARAMLDHCPEMTVGEIFHEVFPYKPARPQ